MPLRGRAMRAAAAWLKTPAGAVAFLIFATVTIHLRFVRDPVAGTDQIVHIIKNIAIIGGLLTFVAF